MAFSSDGQRLAVPSGNEEVKVWDIASGQAVCTVRGAPKAGARCLAFSPDGQRLAVGSGTYEPKEQGCVAGEVLIWDAATGQHLLTVKGHSREVKAVAFSPDGRLLASACFYDGTTKVWDAIGGRELYTLKGAGSLAFSPDGRRLAAACSGRTEPEWVVKIWDVTSGQELGRVQAQAGSLAFSPDSRLLAVTAADGTIRICDGRPLTPELSVEHEALGLVDFLFDKLAWKPDVEKAVRAHQGITQAVRDKALALAEHYRDDPDRFNAAAWRVVRQPGAPADRYRHALRQAEFACKLAPEAGTCLTTLGVAQYRVGRFQDAVDTLTRAEKINRPRTPLPGDPAFLAMAHHQLGQKDKAAAALALLRKRTYHHPAALADEAKAFRREARELIDPKAATPK